MVGALRRCENLVADLLAEQGRLITAAMLAEAQVGYSAVTTQATLNELSAAQGQAAATRAHLVAGHRQLERLAKRMGFDISLYGDTGKPPLNDGFVSAIDASKVEA